jgi:hypothetical protein
MPSPHPFALLQAYASHLSSPVPVVHLATSTGCPERFSSVSQLFGISDEETYEDIRAVIKPKTQNNKK